MVNKHRGTYFTNNDFYMLELSEKLSGKFKFTSGKYLHKDTKKAMTIGDLEDAVYGGLLSSSIQEAEASKERRKKSIALAIQRAKNFVRNPTSTSLSGPNKGMKNIQKALRFGKGF